MSEETKLSAKPTITIDGNLAAKIKEEIGENQRMPRGAVF